MANLLDKPERWRKRAEEMRTIADGMREPTTKRMMLDLAVSYDHLAERADQRLALKREALKRMQGGPGRVVG
jgi:hypothetical protein